MSEEIGPLYECLGLRCSHCGCEPQPGKATLSVSRIEITDEMVKRAARAIEFDSKLSYESTARAALEAALNGS